MALMKSPLFQTRDRPVQRSRPEIDTGELADVRHHGVTVLGAIGQARKDENVGSDIYYVAT